MLAVEIQDYARRLMEAGLKAIAEAAQKARSFEEQGQNEQADDVASHRMAMREMAARARSEQRMRRSAAMR